MMNVENQEYGNMKVGQVVIVIVLVLSLMANMWMANERLQVKFYKKGLTDGAKTMSNRVIEEVQKTGRLNLKMPSGNPVVLVAQKPVKPPAAKNQDAKDK